jgi:sugar/nucleoside kinase (ribokinase family)
MRGLYDVVVVGDYCLDLIFTGLPNMPELGVEIVSKGFEMIPGGPYNTVVALHRLGLRVGWACDYGEDPFSQFVLERAQEEGIDSSLFIRHKACMRNITVSLSYPEERAFVAYYDPAPSIPAVIKRLPQLSSHYIYLPGIYTGAAFDAGLMLVKLKHIQIIMDGNSPETVSMDDPAVRKAIQAVGIFMPNAREVCRLTGKTELLEGIRELQKWVPLLVVKDGTNGAYAAQDGHIIHVPGLRLTPLDTTGAGDCFNAGFIKARMLGATLEECLKWGNIVGGLSTLGYGGTGMRVTENEVREQMSTLE